MKKKNVLRKDLYMELKKSWPRFLSILIMVWLGVAFFSGIRACGPDMKLSVDTYYDRVKLMDIRVLGDLGVTKEDIKEIEKVEGIEKAEGEYTLDVLWQSGENLLPVKLMSVPKTMNQITVKEGRLPEKEGECLIDSKLAKTYSCQIGDQMDFSSGTETKLSKSLKNESYKVVGIGNSPYYISTERGTTTVGNGELKGFVILSEEDFSMPVYTQITALVKGTKDLLCYSDDYENRIDQVIEKVEKIAGARCRVRYASVKQEAKDQITDGEEELKKAKKKLSDGQEKIDKAKKELVDGKKEIEKNEALLKEQEEKLNQAKQTIEDGTKKIKDGKKELEKGEKELTQSKKKLEKAKNQYLSAKKEYDQGKSQLDAAKAQVEQAKKELLEGEKKLKLLEQNPEGQEAQIEQIKQQILAARKQIDQAEAQIHKEESVLSEGKKQLDEAKKQLDEGEAKYQKGKKEFDSQKALLEKKEKELKKASQELKTGETKLLEAKNQLETAKEELKKGETDYKKAEKTWKEKKADGEKKIKKAEKELEDAKKEYNELEMPEWYVLSRQSIQTYVEYDQDSQRIAAIGQVFPVIFFLVAALVCLTTMTRMVQEDRTQIGVLKALGYTQIQISMKYMVYAMSSSLIGCITGAIFGQKFIPVVVMQAYGMMYTGFSDMLSPLYLRYSLGAGAAAFGCIVFAAYSACKKNLKEVPANLMRPVAPKAGKRILLEKIPFIWNRLNFSRKAAVRNLMRYKKRLAMTVLGIGACMGILIVGFGIKDSILAVGTLQFGKVRLYDSNIALSEDRRQKEEEEVFRKLNSDDRIKEWIEVQETSGDVCFHQEEKSASFVIPKEPERLNHFISLADRKTQKGYQLRDEGVILTEKLASLLGVTKGDSIELKEGDEEKGVSVIVSGVVENYFSHYVFLSPALYENLFGKKPQFDNIYTSNESNEDNFEKTFQDDYLKFEAVSGVSFVSGTAKRVKDMLKSMDGIIWIIVTAAGLLAFVVLYNLNNINISERKRELATLKVLGFYDKEVSQYIFRENSILTFLGMITGVGIGILLHRFIILTVEIDMLMFGREISLKSYVLSGGITLLFSAVVNCFMHFKMKKINMIESLKSVE